MSEYSDSSSSSSDDDNPPEISDEFEKCFFKTLSSLKNNDPSIYDKEKKFFDGTSSVIIPSKTKMHKEKDKPMFLKDYERKCLTEKEGYENEDEDRGLEFKNDELPYVMEQRELKESFKTFLSDSEDEGNDTLLKPLVKSKEDVEKEESDYIQWLKGQKEELEDKSTEQSLKNLRDYWNSDQLDENESFLKDYILNKRFLDKSDSEDDENNLTEDSETYEAQENYEQKYNFRFETGEDLIRRFPRNIENSLRRKDNKRSKKRAEVKERKELEKKKKRDEINRQKKLKVKEIAEHLKKLKELTGNEKLAFNDNDILGDFDPDEHDKKMSAVYNDEFYNKDDDEKPSIDDLDLVDEFQVEECDEINYGYDDEKLSKRNKKTRTKRKKERKKKAFSDISLIEKPIYDPKLHESYQKYMDEYYDLDCEDFIEDIPCRYKYKQVEPNDFGLTIEEILCADDKELNRWSSIKKIYKIRPSHVEKNEAKTYKRKAENEALKQKILPSLYIAEGEEEEGNFEDKQNNKSEKNSKNTDLNSEDDSVNANVNNSKNPSDITSGNKKKNKKRKRSSDGNKTSEDSTESSKVLKESAPDVTNGLSESVISGSVSNNGLKESKTFNSKLLINRKKFNNNKLSKYQKGSKFKKRHDFHDSRLSAYGINPKKFRPK